MPGSRGATGGGRRVLSFVRAASRGGGGGGGSSDEEGSGGESDGNDERGRRREEEGGPAMLASQHLQLTLGVNLPQHAAGRAGALAARATRIPGPPAGPLRRKEFVAGGAGAAETMIPRCPSSGSSSYVRREPEVPVARGGGWLGMNVAGGAGGAAVSARDEAASLRLMESMGLGPGDGGGGVHSARVNPNLGTRQQKGGAGALAANTAGAAYVFKVFGRESADLATDGAAGGESPPAMYVGAGLGHADFGAC